MKLKDEQGNEWEFSVEVGNWERKYGTLIKLEPNPMPDLEDGDWYMIKYPYQDFHIMRKGNIYQSDNIIEIRKSNGTVWRRDGKK